MRLLDDYMSTNELAREFDRDPRTIQRWVRQRILPPPSRVGRLHLHHVPTVRKRLEELAATGGEAA